MVSGRSVGLLLFLAVIVSISAVKDSMLKKSIVFDKNTPDVFYCPQQKPTGLNKMIVRAKPLSKLCEFGMPLPEDYKSDCYNDVDETDYACKEKSRIMMRMHPPGMENAENEYPFVRSKDKVIKVKVHKRAKPKHIQ